MLLSNVKVQNAKPQAKPYKLKDGDGLFLLVHPNGGKYWRLRYSFAGKEKLLALGTYPQISLLDAREKRNNARKLVANGTDPSFKKKEDKRLAAFAANNTFEAVAKDWHETNKSKWTPEHAERLWRRLELYIFKDLGKLPISSIRTPDLIPVLRKQENAGTLDTARRVAQVLNVVFRYAVHCGLIDQNPASDLRGVVTPHKATSFPLRSGKEQRLLEMVDLVSGIEPVYEMYPGFKKIGKASCQKEMDTIGRLAEKLAVTLSTLHEPTIRALANVGFAKFGPDYPFKPCNDRLMLQELCENLANAAKKADVSKVPAKYGAGRPQETVANMTAKLLAQHFHELTGGPPTIITPTKPGKAYGPFLTFVQAVFEILDISASPEAAARLAKAEFRFPKEEKAQKSK